MLVEDVLRTVTFYRDVLGFAVVLVGPGARGGGPTWALLRRGPAEVLVQARAALAGVLPLSGTSRPGALTLLLEADDVAVLYERVRSHACLVRPLHAPRPGLRAVAVLDPDGVLLVFSDSAREERAQAA